MTRQELHDLAAAGVANRIKDIERELAEYHKEWPRLFLTPTPPQLLAAAKKAAGANGNGSGHWPVTTVAPIHKGLSAKIVAFLGTKDRATYTEIQTETGGSNSGLNRALNKLVESRHLAKVERGLYVLSGGEPPPPPPRKQKQPQKWTPAMRKAAAARMRAMHKDGRIAKGQAKARREKSATA